MITDLPVLAAVDLPVTQWHPGVPVAAGVGGRPDLVRLRCTPADLPALAGTLRADGPRVRLELQPGEWRGEWLDALDVGALVTRGVVECGIDTAALGTGREWVRLVAFLVAAREHGLEPSWCMTPATPAWVGVALLGHLTPPSTSPTAGALPPGDRAAWVSTSRFGTLYWRRGPGFASVVDSRGEHTTRYLIDDAALLALFLALERPLEVAALDDADRAGLADLVEAGLVVADDGVCVRLPYRLRHRPMPGNQV